MAERFLYEADRDAFLDRVRRTREHLARLTSGESIDVERWSDEMRALNREVEPLAGLALGVRYRVRTVGGPLRARPLHVKGAAGEVVGLDLPEVGHYEFVEFEGIYRGRGPAGPWVGLLIFVVAGQYAALADSDVLRCEEVAA